MRLEMMTKEPGPGGLRLRPTGLDISFEKAFGTRYPDAYERLLMDTVRGNADAVHAARRGRGGLGLGRADHRGLGEPARRAAPLPGRKLGADRLDRADRARRPHLARGAGLTDPAGTIAAAAWPLLKTRRLAASFIKP